ncbi:MAG TPA: hypothetical protein VK457_24050 [Chloroflexota bacterium]|nr:hypothetical protein [Chloroflexota bacterium]
MPTVLYVGTDEGVVTINGNGSWEAERPALASWEVCGVAVQPSHPSVVFAATRGDGVWRSDDAGKSWKKPSYGRRGPGKVRCVTLDPNDERTLYAGAEPIDVFVSHDAGASWECLDSVWNEPFIGTITYPVAVVEPHVRDIAVDPSNPKVMYVALQVGFMLKTTDGGATWKLLNKQLDADVHTVRLNPRDPRNILIATGGHDYRLGTAPGKALYRSEDGGESWQPTGASFAQEYSVPLEIDPKNPHVAFAGLANGTPNAWRRPTGAEGAIVRTTDGGETWQEVATDVPDRSQRMAIGIAIDPIQPSNVYAALHDGHLLASHDGGDSWTQLEVRTPRPNGLKCARL